MNTIRDASNPRQLKEVIDGLVRQFDNTGTLKLTQDMTTTTIINGKVNEQSVVVLSPATATAAAELLTTFVSDVSESKFTITHLSSADTNRVFSYVIFGV